MGGGVEVEVEGAEAVVVGGFLEGRGYIKDLRVRGGVGEDSDGGGRGCFWRCCSAWSSVSACAM